MANTEDDGKCETCGVEFDTVVAEYEAKINSMQAIIDSQVACGDKWAKFSESFGWWGPDDFRGAYDALVAEREDWRKRYEDLESHRGACCMAMEEEVKSSKDTLTKTSDMLVGAYSEIAELREENKKLRGLLKVAVCPACDGSGGIPHPVQAGCYGVVTHEMAMDAGDLSIEGTEYGDDEWSMELEQCQWCDERKKILGTEDKKEEVPF